MSTKNNDKNKMGTDGLETKLFIKTDVKELQTVDLAECLELDRDILLKQISMTNGLEPIPSPFDQQKRKIIRSQLVEKIPKTFEEKLPYLLLEQRELLERVMASQGVPETEVNLQLWDYLMAIGFLFVCFTGEEFYLFVPNELKEQYCAKKEQLKETWQRHDQIWFYTKALLCIYGAYDSGWHTKVWNQHNRQKTTVQETEDCWRQLWNLQDEGWFSGGFFISNYFNSEETMKAFFQSTEDIPYYMPSKKDILVYFDHLYETDSVYGNKLYQMFADYEKQNPINTTPLEAIEVVAWACILDLEESEILDELEHMDIVFQEPDTEKRFLTLYQGMSYNTRKWALCGWRPMDLIS